MDHGGSNPLPLLDDLDLLRILVIFIYSRRAANVIGAYPSTASLTPCFAFACHAQQGLSSSCSARTRGYFGDVCRCTSTSSNRIIALDKPDRSCFIIIRPCYLFDRRVRSCVLIRVGACATLDSNASRCRHFILQVVYWALPAREEQEEVGR